MGQGLDAGCCVSAWRGTAAAAAWASLLLLAPPLAAADKPAVAPKFAPLAGQEGYQEIPLGVDSWYVAFHGTRSHSMPTVEAGWAARAAQLCLGAHKGLFVALRYVGEPVVRQAPTSGSTSFRPGWLRPAGAVYVPIFIPEANGPPAPYLTPSRQGAILCVSSADVLADPSRARDGREAIDLARKAGYAIG